jgi:hypothetical protein
VAMAVAAASGVCDCCGREKVSAVVSVAAVNAEMEVVAVLLLLTSPTDGTTIFHWPFHH